MNITSVFTSVSMMTVIIFLGILLGRKITVDEQAKKLLMTIIINISVPAIILNGIISTEIHEQLLSDMFFMFVVSVASSLTGIGLGWFIAYVVGFRASKARKIAILAALGNTGFIGIPLCAQLFGPIGGLLAAVFDAGLDVVVFSLAIMMLQQDKSVSFKSLKALINIPMFAIMIGIIMVIIGFEAPTIVSELTARLSVMASPLAMLYVGLLIPELIKGRKKIAIGFVSLSLVLKLLLFPVLMVLVIQIMPLSTQVKQVAFIQVSMPTFMLATVLFARYAKDEDTAVLTTIYSTLLSLVTIPLIAYFVSTL